MRSLTVLPLLGIKRICVASMAACLCASTAHAADIVYVRCADSSGDFRISELNHSVMQFSDRYQEYRPVCRDCDIVEWGSRIVMRGPTTTVQINRISGSITIDRSNVKPNAMPTDLRSFRGTCVKGKVVVVNNEPKEIRLAF